MNFTAEQQQAINVRGKSIAVSAAAGSGKTAVLTRRIIERVCASDGSGDISRILAVTYTKAAAAEITSRVAAALSDKLAEDPSNKHIARQALFVGSAKISTIHRFCLDIIHENFEKLGLPSDFAAADETKLDIMSDEIMGELIDECFEGTSDITSDIEDFSIFADTFGSFAGTDELCEALLKIYAKLSCKMDFLESLNYAIQMYNEMENGDFSSSDLGFRLLEHLKSMLEHHNIELCDALDKANENETGGTSVSAIEDDIRAISTLMFMAEKRCGYEEISSALNAYSPSTMRFAKGVSGTDIAEYIKKKRNAFKHDIREMRDRFFSFSTDDIRYFAKETAKRISELKIVLTEFHKRFSQEKIRRHIVSFSDMEHYALDLLWDRENDAPSDIAKHIRDGFDEIYIDEYQDTNEVQDKIFSLVSRENNKFCVGDIKQSIYGFRGSEPSIFEKMLNGREKYVDGAVGDGTKIFLSKNFRSSNEIIDFCNVVFSKLMTFGGGRYGEDEKLHSGTDRKTEKAEIVVLDKEDDEENEAEYVANRISELIQSGTRPSDIAILLRSAVEAPKFEKALARRGVNCRNTANFRLFDSPEVQLMLAILNVIDNPHRDVYLAAALSSPLYGVTLDELIYIRRKGERSLYDALCGFTSSTGFKKGERFLSDIEKFRKISRSCTCDSLIWQIYMDTDIISYLTRGDDEYAAEESKANLIQLYNYAREYENGSYRGLYDFISFVNDAISGKKKIDLAQFSSSGDAVSIVTIHKSKGLEYPVCFLCLCSKKFNMMDLRSNVLMTKYGPVPKLVHRSGLGRVKTLQYLVSAMIQKRELIAEELRVLYVALTRPKDKLIVTASKKDADLAFDKNETVSDFSVYKTENYIDMITSAVSGSDVYIRGGECNGVTLKKEKTEDCDDIPLIEAKRVVRERFGFKYPRGSLSKLPSKMSVSKLYPEMLDENDDDMKTASESDFGYMPQFLREESGGATAAERGTATHTFMQFFDFDRVYSNGVRTEVEYLASKRFIYPDDVSRIDVRGLERFFASPLAKSMREAREIYREKRFMLNIPAEEFTSDEKLKIELSGESLLVQGVIDCVYRASDGLVLVDYKTDSFKRGTPREEIESVLRERHSKQLMYYKRACNELFGKIEHVYIYSFALGDVVEI